MKPCKVELCPAFAAPGSIYCVGHKLAKRLHSVAEGRTCDNCRRVLKEGDYVTRESTPGRLAHAVCPKDKPKPPRRTRGETPLFDGA